MGGGRASSNRSLSWAGMRRTRLGSSNGIIGRTTRARGSFVFGEQASPNKGFQRIGLVRKSGSQVKRKKGPRNYGSRKVPSSWRPASRLEGRFLHLCSLITERKRIDSFIKYSNGTLMSSVRNEKK